MPLLFILLFLALAAYGQQFTIAVLPSDSDVLNNDELEAVTDKMRESVLKILSDDFILLKQDVVIKRLGGAENYIKVCSESSCIVDLGKKAQVDYVSQASVGKLGGKLRLKIELYNVKTGGLLGMYNEYFDNFFPLIDALDKHIPDVFKKITGDSGNKATPPAVVFAAPQREIAPPPKLAPQQKTAPPKQVVEEEDETTYDEEDEIKEEVAAQEKYDNSRYEAVGSATQIFGNKDEYLFWAGMTFLASAIGNGVVGVLQMTKWRDAKKVLDETQGEIDRIKSQIRDTCATRYPDKPWCTSQSIRYAEGKDLDTGKPIEGMDDNKAIVEGRPLWISNKRLDHNQKVTDSYSKASIIFFSASAVSLAISVTLFVW